jgi:hypothetical protein
MVQNDALRHEKTIRFQQIGGGTDSAVSKGIRLEKITMIFTIGTVLANYPGLRGNRSTVTMPRSWSAAIPVVMVGN